MSASLRGKQVSPLPAFHYLQDYTTATQICLAGQLEELGASQVFWVLLKIGFANYTQCIFLTLCNTHM